MLEPGSLSSPLMLSIVISMVGEGMTDGRLPALAEHTGRSPIGSRGGEHSQVPVVRGQVLPELHRLGSSRGCPVPTVSRALHPAPR